MKQYMLRAGIILMVAVIVLFTGCASGSITQPDTGLSESSLEVTASGIESHQQWGLWQFSFDPATGRLEPVPMRFSNLHLNALKFLEPPAYLHLTVENLQISGNQIDVDLGLRHPFLGLDRYTGFDVTGIFISYGSVSGFDDSALVMSGDGDSRLVNADGLTRWWNPSEFPHDGTMFSYKDGLLGASDEIANFNSTLNGYKYFTDGLDPLAPLSDVGLQSRGKFTAGQKNTRHYVIKMSGGPLVFNYAVDANWKQPAGSPPWNVPDDFAPAANRAEPWRVEVTEMSNTLWNDGESSGGGLSLSLDVYDWFNADLCNVMLESPGNFVMQSSSTVVGSGPGFSTYEVEILSATPAENNIELLISAASEESGYGGILPGVPVTAYFTHTSMVDSQTQSGHDLILEDPQQIIDPIHEDWPQLDDFSPTIGETPDESMLVIWYAVNDTDDIVGSYGGGSNWGSALFAFKSFDSGSNWDAGQQEHFGVGGSLIMRNGLKSLPYSSGTRMHCVWPGYPSSTSSTNYVSQIDYTNQHHVFWKTKGDRAVDAVLREDSNLVVFSDNGHEINAQVSTGSDWDDPSPFWYPPGETHPDHLVADPGYLSDVRSAARDEDGRLWLVYYTGEGASENSIGIADSSDGVTWNSVTIFGGNPDSFTEIRNPSIYLFGGNQYVTYTRLNQDSNNYELVLKVGDGSGFSPGVVLAESSVEITDAEVITGQTIGMSLDMVTYSTNGSVFCIWQLDGSGYSDPVKINSNGSEASMSDFIFDLTSGTPDAYLHFVWCERDDPSENWEVFYRRGYIESE